MNNIERGSFKFLIILTIATITIGLVIYPLLDYLYYTFITNSEFTYLVQKHIIKPIFMGIFISLGVWIGEKILSNKKDK